MVLGLTGGMGCGKSTAARQFEAQGFARLDSDEAIRSQLYASQEVIDAMAQHFGGGVLDADGAVNRAWLAGVVFESGSERRWLEGFLHPRLFAYWRTCLAEKSRRSWVFEVPLLFEKQLENWFDFTVCVTTTAGNQLVRLEKRGITRAQAELRISKQLPLARKVELADFVIGNDGTPDFLRLQVDAFIRTVAARR